MEYAFGVSRRNEVMNNFGKRGISLSIFSSIILCFFTIFNLNKTSAAFRFIAIPLFFCFALSFLPFLNSKKKIIKEYVPIFLFGIISIVSTLLSDVVEWSATASSLIIFIILYFVITSVAIDKKDTLILLNFYAYLTLLISIVMIFNYFLGYSLNNGRVSITFFDVRKDENYLSAFLIFGFIYFLLSSFSMNRISLLRLLFSAIIFLAIFLTGSRAALLAMIFSFLIAILIEFIKKGNSIRKLFLIIFGLISISFLMFFLSQTSIFDRMTDIEGFSSNIRLKIWGYAIEAFTRNPLIGSGIQSGTYYAQQSLRWYTHNCFLDLITSVGILGAILFVLQLFMFLQVKKGNKLIMLSFAVAMFFPLFFINGFECATFWFPMILCKLISKSLIVYDFSEVS